VKREDLQTIRCVSLRETAASLVEAREALDRVRTRRWSGVHVGAQSARASIDLALAEIRREDAFSELDDALDLGSDAEVLPLRRPQ
jgi:hypothetical protein